MDELLLSDHSKDNDQHDDFNKDDRRQDTSKDRQDELNKGHHDEEHHQEVSTEYRRNRRHLPNL